MGWRGQIIWRRKRIQSRIYVFLTRKDLKVDFLSILVSLIKFSVCLSKEIYYSISWHRCISVQCSQSEWIALSLDADVFLFFTKKELWGHIWFTRSNFLTFSKKYPTKLVKNVKPCTSILPWFEAMWSSYILGRPQNFAKSPLFFCPM